MYFYTDRLYTKYCSSCHFLKLLSYMKTITMVFHCDLVSVLSICFLFSYSLWSPTPPRSDVKNEPGVSTVPCHSFPQNTKFRRSASCSRTLQYMQWVGLESIQRPSKQQSTALPESQPHTQQLCTCKPWIWHYVLTCPVTFSSNKVWTNLKWHLSHAYTFDNWI